MYMQMCWAGFFQCRPHPVIITSSMFEERERKKFQHKRRVRKAVSVRNVPTTQLKV